MENVVPTSEKRSLRHDFTAVEMNGISMQLANKTKEMSSVKDEKKSVTSQYSARLNEIQATVNRLSNQITDGFEMRDIDCEIQWHKPEQGKKTVIRKDSNTVVAVEKMTDFEWNLFNQPEDLQTTELLDEQRDKLRGSKPKGGKKRTGKKSTKKH